jgi:hypothetical protein
MKSILLLLFFFLPIRLFAQTEYPILFKNYCVFDKGISIWNEDRQLIKTLRVKANDSIFIMLPANKWYYYECADFVPKRIKVKGIEQTKEIVRNKRNCYTEKVDNYQTVAKSIKEFGTFIKPDNFSTVFLLTGDTFIHLTCGTVVRP